MFEIRKAVSGDFYFILKAKNGRVLCTSEMYKSKQKCKKGVRSVVKNAAKNQIEDLT